MQKYTNSGKLCQHWNSTKYIDATFPDATIEDALNYCRNPVNVANTDPPKHFDSPWCYTTDPTVLYERCNIPACEEPGQVLSHVHISPLFQSVLYQVE